MTSAIPNTLDPRLVGQFKADIERLEAEMDVFKAEHMARCKKQRELINGYYDRARDAGIPVKALKTEIKATKLEKRANALRDALEDDDADSLEMIREALGTLADLPLGQAAMADKPKSKRQAKAEADAAAVDSLAADAEEDPRPRFLKKAEEDRAAENAEKIGKGIKPLH